MNSKGINKDRLRIVTEIIFLVIFILLLRNQSLQRWILVFGGGVLISLVFGRLYCAWACPIGTLFRPVNWVFDKLGINRFKTPEIMKQSWLRWVILIVFVGLMITFRMLKIRLNLLLYITLLGVLVTLFFTEDFWHHRLCPYGAVLSASGRVARLGMEIDEEECTGCGLCEKACPAEAISALPTGEREIKNSECLTCFKCQEVCPVDAIEYNWR